MAPSRPKESEEDPLLNTKPSLLRGKKGRDAGTVDDADADTTTTTRQALPWTRGAVALASLLVIGTSASALLNQHVANDVPEYFFSISVFLPFSGLILCVPTCHTVPATSALFVLQYTADALTHCRCTHSLTRTHARTHSLTRFMTGIPPL
jgi:hypothetical protein